MLTKPAAKSNFIQFRPVYNYLKIRPKMPYLLLKEITIALLRLMKYKYDMSSSNNQSSTPVGIYLFKVNNENTKTINKGN